MKCINHLTLLVVFLLSGCVEKKITKDFQSNIEDLNEFYRSDQSRSETDGVLVYPAARALKKKCRKATIKANNIKISEFATLLSDVYGVNINYATDVNVSKKGTKKSSKAEPSYEQIYMNMTNVCISEVFESIVENYDIGIKRSLNGYFIYPRQLRTETFSVSYHNFYRKGKSSIAIAHSNLQEGAEKDNYSAISSESEEHFWNSVSDTIRSILSADKERTVDVSGEGEAKKIEDFYVYKESGLVVVTAYPRQLRYIKNFLDKVNGSSTAQVLIEAKILEVELRDEFNQGIQWDLLKKSLRYTSFSSLAKAIPSNSSVHNTFNLGSEEDLIAAALSGRVSNKSGFNIVMQALAAQGKISVISSPRVLALNNQRSLIKSGEDRYFVTNVTNLTLNANTTNASTQSGFELAPFFSGVALDTTPRILSNNQILLHVHPMISRVEDEDKRIKIDNKDTVIPVAMIQSREADAVVRATSGDIVILGGMTQNYVKMDESGLPLKPEGFLAKLLGLLSAKNQLSKKVELIILIKPTIINNFDNFNDIGTFDT